MVQSPLPRPASQVSNVMLSGSARQACLVGLTSEDWHCRYKYRCVEVGLHLPRVCLQVWKLCTPVRCRDVGLCATHYVSACCGAVRVDDARNEVCCALVAKGIGKCHLSMAASRFGVLSFVLLRSVLTVGCVVRQLGDVLLRGVLGLLSR